MDPGVQPQHQGEVIGHHPPQGEVLDLNLPILNLLHLPPTLRMAFHLQLLLPSVSLLPSYTSPDLHIVLQLAVPYTIPIGLSDRMIMAILYV